MGFGGRSMNCDSNEYFLRVAHGVDRPFFLDYARRRLNIQDQANRNGLQLIGFSCRIKKQFDLLPIKPAFIVMSGSIVSLLLIMAVIILMVLVILPFWLSSPKTSKDKRVIKGVIGRKNRRYTLLIPEKYSDIQRNPLVIALHYGGHGTPYYGEFILRDLIAPALGELNAIMVAPDCPAKDWTAPDSETLILDLLSYLENQYKIDSQKVLITGYSIGGIGTWHMAGRFPGRFAAALAMAAQPPKNFSIDEWSVPMYVIHGRDDEVFPIVDTTKVVIQMENQKKDVAYRILEQVRHFETYKYISPLKDAIQWVIDRWGNIEIEDG
jgi:hypothetical protein